jgi:hypothetical protein
METDELEELVRCFDCGAMIAPGPDRAYAISDESFLCFECAERRGGRYDHDADEWIVAPNVADEPDERRPHP